MYKFQFLDIRLYLLLHFSFSLMVYEWRIILEHIGLISEPT
jgi:hypothetical protein